MSQSRTRGSFAPWIPVLALAALAAERLAMLAKAAPSDFDDAYMYLRYAHNLLAGEGVAWNPGEGQVFGVTSLLHLGVVTVLRWLFADRSPAGVLAAASGGAAIGLLVALVAMLGYCARHPRLRGNWFFWTAVVLPLVAYREAFGFHATTGMDTMLSALANAFVVFATLRLVDSPRTATLGWATLAAVLAVLARPDNVLCAFFCPLLALVLPRPRGKLIARFIVMCGGGLAIVAGTEWLVLGSPVPLSYFAKQPWYYLGFAGEYTWNPYLFLKVFGYSAWPFIAALIVFADGAGWKRAAVLLTPTLASIAVLFHFNQIMGHLARFDYPFLPFFVAAGALEFDRWLARGQSIHSQTMIVRAVLAASVLVAASMALSSAGAAYARQAREQRLASPGGYTVPDAPALPEMDSWQAAHAIAGIAQAAPDRARFAMSEHGLPGALAPRTTIIDLLGLHDPYFARHGFSAAELFRRKPDLIWLPHEDHTQMLKDIVGSDEFWAHYDFYPDAFFYGLAVRKDGEKHERVRAAVQAQWRSSYPDRDLAAYRAERGE